MGGMLAAKAKKAAPAAPAPTKVLMKTEDDYEPVNRWWEREGGENSGKRGAKKWDTFEHHGLMFAPVYEPHGLPIKYDGKEKKEKKENKEDSKENVAPDAQKRDKDGDGILPVKEKEKEPKDGTEKKEKKKDKKDEKRQERRLGKEG